MCELFVLLCSEEPLSAEDREVLLNLLDPEERKAILTAGRTVPREERLCGWALARLCLCRVFGLDNKGLRIERNRDKKPVVAGAHGCFFNLSHTKGGVAVAVSDREVGVDIEKRRPVPDRIAARFFSEQEQQWLREASDWPTAFFYIWTRKEACIKYTGKGLSTPLPSVETLTPPWSERLSTISQGGYTVSLCSAESPGPYHLLGREELLAGAKELG